MFPLSCPAKQVVFVGKVVVMEDWKDVYGDETSLDYSRKKSAIEKEVSYNNVGLPVPSTCSGSKYQRKAFLP